MSSGDDTGRKCDDFLISLPKAEGFLVLPVSQQVSDDAGQKMLDWLEAIDINAPFEPLNISGIDLKGAENRIESKQQHSYASDYGIGVALREALGMMENKTQI